MAEENNPQENAGQKTGPQFVIQRVYLKDMSFEAPMGVEAFKQQWNPKISQDLNTATSKIDEDLYEVVLKLTISASLNEKVAFLIEVQQAGLFFVKGFDNNQLTQALNAACPQILFPYAREAIDNAAVKGGFPALALPPINFDMLFAQAIAKAKKEAETATTN